MAKTKITQEEADHQLATDTSIKIMDLLVKKKLVPDNEGEDDYPFDLQDEITEIVKKKLKLKK